MYTIKKGPLRDNGVTRTAADQFYSLITQVILTITEFSCLADVIATQPGSEAIARAHKTPDAEK